MMADWSPQDKLQWQRMKLAQHVAKGQIEATENVKRFIAGEPMLKTKPHKQFEDINKKLNKLSKEAVGKVRDRTGPSRREVEGAAREGKTLVATQPSDCFDSLSWRNGVATAVFSKGGGAGTYDYEMDLDTFLEWCADESLGGYFNAEIR